MKCVLVFSTIFVASLAAGPAMSQANPDEGAIRAIVQEEVTAWNAGDAAAYSRHFSPNGIFVNVRGEYRSGVQAFTKQHEFLFNGPFHGSTLHQDVVSVQFVRPDVAVVEVLTAVTGIQKLSPGTTTDEKGRLRTRLLQVLVKDGGEWKITDYHNTDIKAHVPVPEPQ
ncbi:MAG TPA: SgcJ/EcaC family oxidoreductase [Bryocella sp.]|nr:SgcJ/EcaC family oxidoreductase [Bryocella sp.]